MLRQYWILTRYKELYGTPIYEGEDEKEIQTTATDLQANGAENSLDSGRWHLKTENR